MISRCWVSLLPILFVLLGSTGAQQRNDLLSVSSVGSGRFSVHIGQTGKLYPLLQELCRQTRSECEISASAASEAILVPMTITGTWNEVIGKMLEGTEFNFAATGPTKAHESAKLVIQNKPTGADPYVPLSASAGGYAISGPASTDNNATMNTMAADSSANDNNGGSPQNVKAGVGVGLDHPSGSQEFAGRVDILSQLLSRAAEGNLPAAQASGSPLPAGSVELNNPSVDHSTDSSAPPLPVAGSVELNNRNLDRSAGPLPVPLR